MLRTGPAVVQGVIDAVADHDLFVDYKTGRFDARRQERYRLQLAIYALAMEKLLGQIPDAGVLAYVDEDREEELPFGAAALRKAEERILPVLESLNPPRSTAQGES